MLVEAGPTVQLLTGAKARGCGGLGGWGVGVAMKGFLGPPIVRPMFLAGKGFVWGPLIFGARMGWPCLVEKMFKRGKCMVVLPPFVGGKGPVLLRVG